MVHIFQAIYKRVTVPTDLKEIEEGGYGPHIAHGISFSSRYMTKREEKEEMY